MSSSTQQLQKKKTNLRKKIVVLCSVFHAICKVTEIMTFFYWPDERNARFIKLLKEAPILWDRNNSQYCNRQHRNNMWKKISKEIGEANIQLLKTKVKSFRSNYRAECKKMERDPSYRPVWRYFKPLRFLDNLQDGEHEETNDAGRQKRVTFHRWSDEKTKRLIQLYKIEPTLWNKEHSAISTSCERELVLGNIAAKLNCSVALLKIKIKSLRSNFFSEHKKMIADKNYKPVWRFFQNLAFLGNSGANIIDSDEGEDDSDAFDENNSTGGINTEANTRKADWDETKILKFIDLLKIAPQLWDRHHPDHNNKSQKTIILQNMSKEMGMPADVLENKYKIVRHQFRRHYLKTLKDKDYVPTWRFFTNLEFLADVMEEFNTHVEYLEDVDDDTHNSTLSGIEYESCSPAESSACFNYDNIDSIDDNTCEFNDSSEDDSSRCNEQNPVLLEKTKLVFWSDETTIKFINLLRDQPILWDKGAEFFGSQKKRAECFKHLALDMSSTLAIIKGKYKRLTAEFRGEHRKMQRDPEYKPIWKFFPYLTFIAGDDAFPLYESDFQGQEESKKRVARHWDDEKTLKFLGLLKQNPLLYSRSNQHKSTYEKDIIWHNIAYELNETVDLVRKQYKALRQKCNVELARKRQDPAYTLSWRFLPFAKFLFRAIKDSGEDTDIAEILEEQNEAEAEPISSQLSTQPQPLFKWSDEQIIIFSYVLKKYPVIWDAKHSNYKSKPVRKLAWKKLSQELCIPEDAIKSKYKTLRSQYNEESKKALLTPDYEPTWRFYNYFDFITIERKGESTLQNLHADTDNESDMLSNDYDALEETDSGSIIDYNHANELSNDSMFEDTTNIESVEICPDVERIQQDVQTNGEIESHRSQHIQDEYSAFAEYVANEMRKMSGHRLVELNFKSKVIRAVLEANEALKNPS